MKRYSAVFLVAMMASGVASADLAFVINKANAEQVSQQVASNIYLGKTKSYPGGRKAVAIMVDYQNEKLGGFLQKVMGKDTGQFRAYWSQLVFTGAGVPPQVYKTSDEVVDLVGRNPDLIGIADDSVANPNVKYIKF